MPNYYASPALEYDEVTPNANAGDNTWSGDWRNDVSNVTVTGGAGTDTVTIIDGSVWPTSGSLDEYHTAAWQSSQLTFTRSGNSITLDSGTFNAGTTAIRLVTAVGHVLGNIVRGPTLTLLQLAINVMAINVGYSGLIREGDVLILRDGAFKYDWRIDISDVVFDVHSATPPEIIAENTGRVKYITNGTCVLLITSVSLTTVVLRGTQFIAESGNCLQSNGALGTDVESCRLYTYDCRFIGEAGQGLYVFLHNRSGDLLESYDTTFVGVAGNTLKHYAKNNPNRFFRCKFISTGSGYGLYEDISPGGDSSSKYNHNDFYNCFFYGPTGYRLYFPATNRYRGQEPGYLNEIYSNTYVGKSGYAVDIQLYNGSRTEFYGNILYAMSGCAAVMRYSSVTVNLSDPTFGFGVITSGESNPFDYNAFYREDGESIPLIEELGAVTGNYFTWADLLTRWPTIGPNTVLDEDPLFYSTTPADPNLHISSLSPMVGLGKLLYAQIYDIDGIYRPDPPAIGADDPLSFTPTEVPQVVWPQDTFGTLDKTESIVVKIPFNRLGGTMQFRVWLANTLTALLDPETYPEDVGAIDSWLGGAYRVDHAPGATLPIIGKGERDFEYCIDGSYTEGLDPDSSGNWSSLGTAEPGIDGIEPTDGILYRADTYIKVAVRGPAKFNEDSGYCVLATNERFFDDDVIDFRLPLYDTKIENFDGAGPGLASGTDFQLVTNNNGTAILTGGVLKLKNTSDDNANAAFITTKTVLKDYFYLTRNNGDPGDFRIEFEHSLLGSDMGSVLALVIGRQVSDPSVAGIISETIQVRNTTFDSTNLSIQYRDNSDVLYSWNGSAWQAGAVGAGPTILQFLKVKFISSGGFWHIQIEDSGGSLIVDTSGSPVAWSVTRTVFENGDLWFSIGDPYLSLHYMETNRWQEIDNLKVMYDKAVTPIDFVLRIENGLFAGEYNVVDLLEGYIEVAGGTFTSDVTNMLWQLIQKVQDAGVYIIGAEAWNGVWEEAT